MAYDAYPANLEDVEWVTQEELFQSADVISLHCPLFESTMGVVNKDTLALMKPSAYLVNTSRGPLVIDKDLADALNNGVIAGAGLDVLDTEPPSEDNPLLTAKNAIITPHVGWATIDARRRLVACTAENYAAFLEGSCRNVIN
jgi:glycerate dehydrogenase